MSKKSKDNFSGPVLIYFINMTCAGMVLLMIWHFWGIEKYGLYAAFSANLFILIQLVGLGNASALVADLASKSASSQTIILRHYVLQTLFRGFNVCILLVVAYILLSDSLPDSLNLITFLLFPYVLIGATNKTLIYYFTFTDRFSTYARVSIFRSFLLLSSVLVSWKLESFESLFFLMFLNELFLFLTLLVLSKIAILGYRRVPSGFETRNLKKFVSLSFNSLYFELYPKIDFILIQFFVSNSFLGVYAILSAANEAFQTLFTQYRMRLTPNFFTDHDNRPISNLDYDSRVFHFVFAVLALSALSVTIFFTVQSNESLLEICIIFCLLTFANFLLAKPFIFGFAHQQLGKELLGAKLLFLHLFSFSATFFLSVYLFNITIAWMMVLLVCLVFRYIFMSSVRRLFETSV